MQYKPHVQHTASCGGVFALAKLPKAPLLQHAEWGDLVAQDRSGNPLKASERTVTRLCQIALMLVSITTLAADSFVAQSGLAAPLTCLVTF